MYIYAETCTYIYYTISVWGMDVHRLQAIHRFCLSLPSCRLAIYSQAASSLLIKNNYALNKQSSETTLGKNGSPEPSCVCGRSDGRPSFRVWHCPRRGLQYNTTTQEVSVTGWLKTQLTNKQGHHKNPSASFSAGSVVNVKGPSAGPQTNNSPARAESHSSGFRQLLFSLYCTDCQIYGITQYSQTN